MTTQMHEEAILFLAEYLRRDTSNPPGDMSGAIDFFSGIFRHEGIPFRVVETAPGMRNIIAKVESSGKKRPIILLNHMDVVPAERDQWTKDPFGGVIEGAFLYGRGALDMKNIGIFQLMALLTLHREKVKSVRDIYFVATCDEEVGGHLGARKLLETEEDLQRAEAVLNEGWPVLENERGTLDHVRIDVSEKKMFQLKLSASGNSGHASLPLGDNANNRLVEALHRVIHWTPRVRVIPTVDKFYKSLSRRMAPDLSRWYENIEASLGDPGFSVSFLHLPSNRAMVMDTVSLTVLQAGGKANVIPSLSEAFIDIRLLPGSNRDRMLSDIREVIGDPGVEVEVYMESTDAPESSTETEAYRAIETVYSRCFPGVPITPNLYVAATDSRFFRERGIDAYGFMPIRLLPGDHRRIHGNDERIALENIKMGTDITLDIVRMLAAGEEVSEV